MHEEALSKKLQSLTSLTRGITRMTLITCWALSSRSKAELAESDLPGLIPQRAGSSDQSGSDSGVEVVRELSIFQDRRMACPC